MIWREDEWLAFSPRSACSSYMPFLEEADIFTQVSFDVTAAVATHIGRLGDNEKAYG